MKVNKRGYKLPPKKIFRDMGLGQEIDGFVKVIAGFECAKWWDPIPYPTPIVVNARIIRWNREVSA